MFSGQLILASIDLWLHLRNFKLMRELEADYDTRLQIACPRNYVERMLWRRFIDRNPAFVTWIDKLAAKELVRERCAEALSPRTLWVGNSPEDLPVELLQPGVWVKANHGSAFNHQVKGEAGEVDEIRRKARLWLGKKYGRKHREWGYHAVLPKLFLETNIAVEAGKLWEFSVRVAGGRYLLGSMMCDSKAPNQWACYLDEHGEPTHGPNDQPGGGARKAAGGFEFSRGLRGGHPAGLFDCPRSGLCAGRFVLERARIVCGGDHYLPFGGNTGDRKRGRGPVVAPRVETG